MSDIMYNLNVWTQEFTSRLNDIAWGPATVAIFLFTGIFFTVKSGFFQFRYFGFWFKNTVIAMVKNSRLRKTKDRGSISQFQALSAALAGTIGTGNIVGVASAIAAGGPGAVFWMWASAFIGMMTSFAEKTLGIMYRYRDSNGKWVGGAMIYIERGMGQKWLAVCFALFCMLASFGMGNMSQSNSIASALNETFGVNRAVTGVILAIVSGIIIMGGIRRLVNVTEKFVPFMAVLYLAGGLIVIISNYENILPAFEAIFGDAFDFSSMAGGVLGFGISKAVKVGISRGVFTNEAGLGSSVAVHASSDVDEPWKQGLWGIFEVFFDTIVVCTITALCILTSDSYLALKTAAPDGAALSIAAFSDVFGKYGSIFISVSISLFAFATIIGWSLYGENSATYIFGNKIRWIFRLCFAAACIAGAVTDLKSVWALSDAFNGFMALPNLAALIFLSSDVQKAIKSMKAVARNSH